MHWKKALFIALAVTALAGIVAAAFLPSPIPVDGTTARPGPFTEYVEDEGYTQLRDARWVSAPISGFLHRVDLEAGDQVSAGDRLFELESLPTPALDARAREQANEAVAAAQARLEAAEAELEASRTQLTLAEAEFERMERLFERGAIAAEERDRRRSHRDATRAAEAAAHHSVEVARFELESARALVEIADGERAPLDQPTLLVRAPIGGTITRRERCCEGPVQSGERILEIGDFSTLEVRMDLLSMDAVRVRPGMQVAIRHWGRDQVLEGEVRRVAPAGYTRVSALGVDEQRVPVHVIITSPREQWASLGDAFRVEARIILWEGEEVLQVPSSALIREDEEWGLFVINDGRALFRPVSIGRRSGLWTEITGGIQPGETIITHPGDRVETGVSVNVTVRD